MSAPDLPDAQSPAPERDFLKIDDDQLISERADLRARLEQLPLRARSRKSLTKRYEELTDEFDRRARAAWRQAEIQLSSKAPKE